VAGKPGDLEFIMKNFDLIEWWRNTGKSQYPMIYPVAMCILSLPDSNGHQERTFSAATWMDGKLNSMQKDLTFQMKVLMYKNEDFLDRYVDTMEPKQLETAGRKTKELLMKHVGSKKEEEIEQDTEYLIEM
jgi:hAT family C-terminal dimerisation region